MPNIAAMTKVRNLLPTWMLKNLYAASVPAKAAKVPITAWVTMPSPKRASKNLLSAPSATPSAAQNASTRAGLMTRLNELTSDSAERAAAADDQGRCRACRCRRSRRRCRCRR